MSGRSSHLAPRFILLAAMAACGGRLASVDGSAAPDAAAPPDGPTAVDPRSIVGGKLLIAASSDTAAASDRYQHLYRLDLGPHGLSLPSRFLSREDEEEVQGVWSPDGSRVAYAVSANFAMSLHVANADGTNDVVLRTTSWESTTWVDGGFAVGQDSVWCAEHEPWGASSPTGERPRIVQISLAGGVARDVWTAPASAADSAISSIVRSADGSHLAFALDRGEVYVLDTRTYEAHRVPDASSQPLGFDRSGERLFFVTPADDLYSSRLDGSDRRLERPADRATDFAALADPFVLGCSQGASLPHCLFLRAARLGSTDPWTDLGDLNDVAGPGGGATATVGMLSP